MPSGYNLTICSMSQHTVNPKASEPENGETGLPCDPKQQTVAVKKTPLRDLPNENNIVVTKSTGNSVFSKEGDNECAKVGTKRPCPDSPANPPHQSPGGNSVNGHLVYVRRKAETESGGNKNTTDETTSDHGANNSSQSRQIVTQPEQEKPQLKESKVACLPSIAPIPAVSNVNYSSGKPSVPHSVTSSDKKRTSNQNWEERYVQLQMFLKKLENSSLEDYLEKLRALPAAELSRHAVELEKRSIQLSLEEANELRRVKSLDVLGKSKSSKPAAIQPEPPQSLQQA
ncbi:hypothetical protein V2J09_020081 [Rumex salicifolius]